MFFVLHGDRKNCYLILWNVVASTRSSQKSTTMNPYHDWSFFINLKCIWYEHVQKEAIFIIIITSITIWTIWSVICCVIIALIWSNPTPYVPAQTDGKKLSELQIIDFPGNNSTLNRPYLLPYMTGVWPEPARKLDRDILDSRIVLFLQNILLLEIRTIREDFHQTNLFFSVLAEFPIFFLYFTTHILRLINYEP